MRMGRFEKSILKNSQKSEKRLQLKASTANSFPIKNGYLGEFWNKNAL